MNGDPTGVGENDTGNRKSRPPVKVLFLDIDGVLNSLEWAKGWGDGFGCPPARRTRCERERLKWCPAMVKRLRRVIETTGASIVISSSWRGYGRSAVRKWRAMFAVYGWHNAPVIGETPDLTAQRASGIYVAVKRGEEVDAWIKAHPHVVDRFVCVDDGERPVAESRRSFREELRQRVELRERLKSEHGIEPKPEFFASTEY